MLKFCKMCGIKIADSRTCDKHRWSALKYCSECAKMSERQNTADRLKALRKRRREQYEAEHEQNLLLKEENALLRQRIAMLRQEVRK